MFDLSRIYCSDERVQFKTTLWYQYTIVDYKESKLEIKESFLGFYPLDKHDAEGHVNLIKAVLNTHNLDISVQKRISDIIPNASFVHCAAHNLNLVLSDMAKSTPKMLKFFNIVQDLFLFFSSSAPGWATLALGDDVVKIVLKKVCTTRWESRHNAVFALKFRYKDVLKSLKSIILTSDKKEENNRAKGLKKKLESFEFVLIIFIWEQILRPFYLVSKKMQSIETNLHIACEYLQLAVTSIENLRDNYECLVNSATDFCNSWGIPVNNITKRKVFSKTFFGDLDGDKRHDIAQENLKVKVFLPVIDTALVQLKYRFLVFELALRGHDEKSNSENPGVFRGLINFSSELDSVLKCHIENSSVFKGLSKLIQNDLLECCLAVCQQRIKNEIKQAEYISVMADETTDVSAQFQLSIIFRYLLSDGTPVERFWGFFNPTGHDAKLLSECIIFNLEKVLESPDMLICQSTTAQTRIVYTVYENLESLIECMKEIGLTFNQTIAINQAGALHRMLNDDRFIFWLRVFHSLMPHVDILYNQLQKQTMDHVELSKVIFRFEENILKERQIIDNIFETSQNNPTKKRRQDDTIEARKIAAKEVCDIFIVNIKERVDYKNHLNASHLFLPTKFPMYENNFPSDHFNKTIEAYPFLDITKLKTELQLSYKRTDFRDINSSVHLLKFIIENNLILIFSESYKLLKIISTIPMTTAKAERSFSTLKRIKTFLRNSMTED
ncbi:hypothetical protein QTP88_022871 [Uroleucon formosanum]